MVGLLVGLVVPSVKVSTEPRQLKRCLRPRMLTTVCPSERSVLTSHIEVSNAASSFGTHPSLACCRQPTRWST